MQDEQSEICRAIIDSANRVYEELKNRPGYGMENFARALAHELRERGYRVQETVAVRRTYHGKSIGTNVIDLIVDGTALVDVKRVKTLTEIHLGRAHTYLLDSGLPEGLLVNFGPTGVQWLWMCPAGDPSLAAVA